MNPGPFLSDFDYYLPSELIAQEPLDERDASRLLVIDRGKKRVEHRGFSDLTEYLRKGDCLVLNDTRVFPARLLGKKEGTGGQVEVLLVECLGGSTWLGLAKPAKSLQPGRVVAFPGGLRASVVGVRPGGERVLEFDASDVLQAVRHIGQVPLPPYIQGGLKDPERYQTVYGTKEGSCAAPTAGFHFTKGLLERVRQVGCDVVRITLHVGPGTFLPVRVENIADHVMHVERYCVAQEAAERVNAARRVVAVGTTAVRTLEASSSADGRVRAGSGRTDLFIYPGYRFRVVDTLLTNFHLPRSTLLMLVCAFAGRERVLDAYQEAVRLRYRFFSFGDAMLIL